MKRAHVWIGISGWVYKHWAANFYPKGWPKKDEFGFYVRHFPTVEINATFYRLPTLAMVRGWRDRSPEGFLFAVKGSRYLTHLRRLNDTGPGLRKYFSRLKPLADRTGPILWQLPPDFQFKEENWRRLEKFLTKLPRHHRHAVEFRHPSWMNEQTFARLRKHRIANVWLSSLRMPADYTLTTDFAYLRFHGLAGGAYHDYTDDELRPWAKQLAHAARRGIPCYVYFNNDLNTRAPLNAHALMRLVGKHAVPAFAPAEAALPDIPAPPKGPETWPAWTRNKVAPASRRQRRKRPAESRHAKPTQSPADAKVAGDLRAPSKSRWPHKHAPGRLREGFGAPEDSSLVVARRAKTGGRVPPRAVRTRSAAKRTRRTTTPAPARAAPRRFAAAQFSASALPPAR